MDDFGFWVMSLGIGILLGLGLGVIIMSWEESAEEECVRQEVIELKSEIEVYKKILKEHYVVEEEWVYVRERENNGDSEEIRGK